MGSCVAKRKLPPAQANSNDGKGEEEDGEADYYVVAAKRVETREEGNENMTNLESLLMETGNVCTVSRCICVSSIVFCMYIIPHMSVWIYVWTPHCLPLHTSAPKADPFSLSCSHHRKCTHTCLGVNQSRESPNKAYVNKETTYQAYILYTGLHFTSCLGWPFN